MPKPLINDPPERNRHMAPIEFDGENPEITTKGDQVDENTEVEEQEDGSAIVNVDKEPEKRARSDFFDNLATFLDENVLDTLARDIVDNVEYDREARKERDKQYAEGIKRTGLSGDAPGGADFDGASKAVHPALVEGCIDFAARAIKEVFPPAGPCRTHIIGTATQAKLQKADRKRQYMNWQLTTQIKEYKRELDVLLTQLPLGGSQYMKFWPDQRYKRPACETVFIDKLHVPFSATNIYTAERFTHEQDITQATFEDRVASGLYRSVPDVFGAGVPEATEAAAAAAKVEGKEDIAYNEDGTRRVLEAYINLRIEGDDKAEGPFSHPYVLTVCEASSKVLALYRNWKAGDEKAERLDWVVDYTMLPWRGAQGIGLAHVIGSLSGAATGALRALLDSAHINNMPGAIKLKGARMSGQNVSIAPTEIAEIEGPTGIDDIRKLAMPLPFNPPSQVLFTLLDWLTTQAKGVIAVAEDKIADAGQNMPVGTALALIEQGSITFSSIHARIHESQAKALAIIHRINGDYMDDEVTVEELGDLLVSKEDFQGPMDIVPISDPNIFSDSQRYAQLQAVLQLASQAPALYKLDKLHKRALQLLKVPELEDLLNVPGEPEDLDAVVENIRASKPEVQLKAYAHQDHLAHLRLHLQFMLSPVFCANPLMGSLSLGKLLEHCKEHLLAYYAQHVLAAAEAQLTVAKSMGGTVTSEDQALTEGAMVAEQEMLKEIAPLMPQLQQAQQLAQQFAPKPPVESAVQVAQINANTALQKANSDAQASMQKVQAEGAAKAQQAQMENALKQQELQMSAAIDKMELQLAQRQHSEEMLTAQRNANIAAMSEEANRKSAEQLATLREQAAKERQETENKFKEFTLHMQAEREQSNLVLQTALGALADKTAAKDAKASEDGKLNEQMQMQAEQLMLLNKAVQATLQALGQLATRNSGE